jgi:hypothetical protein
MSNFSERMTTGRAFEIYAMGEYHVGANSLNSTGKVVRMTYWVLSRDPKTPYLDQVGRFLY